MTNTATADPPGRTPPAANPANPAANTQLGRTPPPVPPANTAANPANTAANQAANQAAKHNGFVEWAENTQNNWKHMDESFHDAYYKDPNVFYFATPESVNLLFKTIVLQDEKGENTKKKSTTYKKPFYLISELNPEKQNRFLHCYTDALGVAGIKPCHDDPFEAGNDGKRTLTSEIFTGTKVIRKFVHDNLIEGMIMPKRNKLNQQNLLKVIKNKELRKGIDVGFIVDKIYKRPSTVSITENSWIKAFDSDDTSAYDQSFNQLIINNMIKSRSGEFDPIIIAFKPMKISRMKKVINMSLQPIVHSIANEVTQMISYKYYGKLHYLAAGKMIQTEIIKMTNAIGLSEGGMGDQIKKEVYLKYLIEIDHFFMLTQLDNQDPLNNIPNDANFFNLHQSNKINSGYATPTKNTRGCNVPNKIWEMYDESFYSNECAKMITPIADYKVIGTKGNNKICAFSLKKENLKQAYMNMDTIEKINMVKIAIKSVEDSLKQDDAFTKFKWEQYYNVEGTKVKNENEINVIKNIKKFNKIETNYDNVTVTEARI